MEAKKRVKANVVKLDEETHAYIERIKFNMDRNRNISGAIKKICREHKEFKEQQNKQ